MEPEAPASVPEAPPEALVIRTAREAAGMAMSQAAAATDGAVSATYWRDVERGYGGRRGKRAPARASARTLAAMAHAVGALPGQLAAARREDAARVLTEILRREGAPAASVSPLRPPAPLPAAVPANAEVADRILADLLSRYEGTSEHGVIAAMAAQRSVPADARVLQVLRFLKDPDLEQEILDWLVLLALPDDPLQVVRALGTRGGAPAQMRIAEVLEFLGWQPPDMEARNGTAGLGALA
jgi:hypothetical protein